MTQGPGFRSSVFRVSGFGLRVEGELGVYG